MAPGGGRIWRCSNLPKASSTARPDIYNHGNMYRDFTYLADLVRGIRLLIDTPPKRPADSQVPQAIAFRPWPTMVNIGNNDKVRLLDFVEALEAALGRKAIRNYGYSARRGPPPGPMQLLKDLTGYPPTISPRHHRFVEWFQEFYGA